MRGGGTTGIAHVEDLRLEDGRPVVDLVTGAGQMSLGVPVPVLGGDDGTMLYVPPRSGQAVTANTGGPGSVMVPLTGWPQSKKQGFQEEAVDVGPDDAYPPDQQTVQDIVLMHRGNKIVLDAQGRLTIHTSTEALRLQVPDGGAVHVHRGEDTTDQSLALAQPVADAINALTRSVSDLVDRVSAIELALQSGVGFAQAVEVGVKAIGTALLTAPLPGGAYAPPEVEVDAIASPAIMVSSETKEG